MPLGPDGKSLPVPESIRIFAMCDNMRWAVLPEPGGLYDQHPELLEDFAYIFSRRAAKQSADHSEMERKSKRRR